MDEQTLDRMKDLYAELKGIAPKLAKLFTSSDKCWVEFTAEAENRTEATIIGYTREIKAFVIELLHNEEDRIRKELKKLGATDV